MGRRKRLTSATLPKAMETTAEAFARFVRESKDLGEAMDKMGRWQEENGIQRGVCNCNTPEQWKLEEEYREYKRQRGTLWESPLAGKSIKEIDAALKEEVKRNFGENGKWRDRI